MKSTGELEWLHFIRDYELSRAFAHFPRDADAQVLEIGSGTGYMLGKIRERFPRAVGLEVEGSAYASADSSINLYDGRTIPYPDGQFDLVFSSHVLEHVYDLPGFLREVRRVLKESGSAVHIIPSPTWRILTSVMHYAALTRMGVSAFRHSNRQMIRSDARRASLFQKAKFILYAPRHGERGNVVTEIFQFNHRRWCRAFEEAGFAVASVGGTGVVYWGRDVFRRSLPLGWREWFAGLIGSSSTIYCMQNGHE